MKRFLKIIIFLFILGSIVYVFRDKIWAYIEPRLNSTASQVINTYIPCSVPIAYSIGDLDQKFGISKEYFLSAVQDAEAIWEKPLGRQFFNYVPDTGGLKINLVYDDRQAATNTLQDLGITVQNNRASYDALKQKYQNLKAQYETAKTAYETAVVAFNQKEKALETEINYWNTKGGAPRDEYNKIQDERASLKIESGQLNIQQNNLNKMVTDVNAFVIVLNRLVTVLNISVDQYNTVGASRGETFEEGVYQSSVSGQKIDIYEFSSREKLVRVLAHELGHALGLDHVDDPKAIMYKLNQGSNETLTTADISVVRTLCKIN